MSKTGNSTFVIRDGHVWNGQGTEQVDVRVEEGCVTQVGRSLAAHPGEEDLDASGCLVLPGLVDIHVHLRVPGGEDAEDIATGSAAAAAGGFCDLVAMGNTAPPYDTAAVVRSVRAEAGAVGLVRVHPAGCVTRGRNGKDLAELHELHRAGCRVFTDDGDPVSDAAIMRRALEYVKGFDGVVADHCEDRSLTAGAQMHEGRVSGRLGLQGWPAAAEEIVVARDILLAEHCGARVHLQHISTAGSVEMVRQAKARGVYVTAEVTPHHLTLTDEVVETFDPVYKVNPPIRSAEHVQAVREGLADGTIDAVATDHAPHTAERKEEWTTAACGMLGLETALPLVWSLVADGTLTLDRMVHAMCASPSRIASLPVRDSVVPGVPADMCVFDTDTAWTVDVHKLRSKASNSPYGGMQLHGRVRHTLLAGRPTVLDGETVPPGDASMGNRPW
ncbi:MAG: dihydroorotase [Actinobacteria bacterium ATB1]|nr:dihydroorotase [Actinobacteria bacterium ATB1]